MSKRNIMVNKVNFDTKKDKDIQKLDSELNGSDVDVMSIIESFAAAKALDDVADKESTLDNSVVDKPLSRNLFDIRKEQKKTNPIDLLVNQKDTVMPQDIKHLEDFSPLAQIEKLETEFFAVKQQILKNTRVMETLKAKMIKSYQEIFPSLTAEEIEQKFKY